MSVTELTTDTITFGKYKGYTLKEILKDRSYCRWLLEQEWFENNYEYIRNRVLEYDPLVFFIGKPEKGINEFLDNYPFFNLKDVDNITGIELSKDEKIFYTFYVDTITNLKSSIGKRIIEEKENIYDIKAPSKWLKKFEETSGLKREDFKIFINSYDLPNITSIVEKIKNEGGLEYKGAKSFLIAKKNSELQEEFWEKILKEKYGEDVGTQFKFEKCIFDFIHIPNNTIYECKLGMKDFDEKQYEKYLTTLDKYKVVYIIGYDCVVDIENKKIYTENEINYVLNTSGKKFNKFDEIIVDYTIEEVKDIKEVV